MGAAAAAEYDTSPPPLRQNPPILLEQSAVDMILQAMNANAKEMREGINGMKNEMEANTKRMENKMDGNTKKMEEMRGEMRQMGQCLQAGMEAITCSETQTAREKMATPCAGTSELKGSAPAGEDRVIRETCWARSVKVTETVT